MAQIKLTGEIKSKSNLVSYNKDTHYDELGAKDQFICLLATNLDVPIMIGTFNDKMYVDSAIAITLLDKLKK